MFKGWKLLAFGVVEVGLLTPMAIIGNNNMYYHQPQQLVIFTVCAAAIIALIWWGLPWVVWLISRVWRLIRNVPQILSRRRVLRLKEREERRPLPEGFESFGRATLDKLYPGFIVNTDDFAFKKVKRASRIYRVNDNGNPVLISMAFEESSRVIDIWHFDDATGEFKKVTQRIGSTNIFETRSYSQRFVAFYDANGDSADNAMKLYFVAAIFFALAVWGAIDPDTDIGAWNYAVVAAFILVAVLAGWLGKLSRNKNVLIGPQPFKRKTEDFGPSAASAPAGHPAADDLAYKPTV